MKKLIVLWCSLSSTMAFLIPSLQLPFTKQKETFSNVCVYSTDPSKFPPKCFLCPNSAFDNILRACVDAATIPYNVTYVQATCLDQNCAINYPQAKNTVIDVRVKRQAVDVISEEQQPTTTVAQLPEENTSSNVSVHEEHEKKHSLQNSHVVYWNNDTSQGENKNHEFESPSSPAEEITVDDNGNEYVNVTVAHEVVIINGREYKITHHEIVFAVADEDIKSN
ncbi:uncharacterized protein LOC129231184 [Uloborus diversus]|uniref:uncharacterized protein LOC129231184 n=1 Tax=Uloborus diversus TaxID=327109 RepID=UPI0024093CD6|nr:uncharacterized protein LOC129231184 [Uloborus diversus]XP_054721416.1 uncharacterized protein LOC129231184 [Uloborus diversus]